MIRWDRTSLDKGYRKAFHVVPAAASFYTDLCAKYGGDNVFQATTAAANLAFTAAIAAAGDDAHDVIYVYPGSYTFAAGVSVTKGVDIVGIGDNAAGAVVTPAAGVNPFTFTAAADNASVRNISVVMTTAVSAKAFVVNSGCNGVVLDGVLVRGTTTLTTVTYIGVLNSGSDLTVKNSRILGMGVAPFQSGLGDRVNLINSQFTTHTVAGIGVDLTTGDFHVVKNCEIVVSTGTGIGVRIGATAASFGSVVENNSILGIAGTAVNAVAGTVFSAQNCLGTTTTTTTTLSIFVG